MKSKHNKLIVSSVSFPMKISSLLRKKIADVRLPILEKIDFELKIATAFKGRPFLWLNIIESYGDYDNHEIIVHSIDEKYGDLGVTIAIPEKEICSLEYEQFESYYEAVIRAAITKACNEQLTDYIFKTIPVYLKGEKEFLEFALSDAREQISLKMKNALEQSRSLSPKEYKNIKILEYFGDYKSFSIDVQKIDTILQSVSVEIALPPSLFNDEDILNNPYCFFEEIYTLVLQKLGIKL